MVSTYSTTGPFGVAVLSIICSFVLISGILTVRNDCRLMMIIVLIALIIALVTRWAGFFSPSANLLEVSVLFYMLTLGYVTFLVFFSLFKAAIVTSTVIWQSISVYLLIGLS